MGIPATGVEASESNDCASNRNIAAYRGNKNSSDTHCSTLSVNALRMKEREIDKYCEKRNEAECVEFLHRILLSSSKKLVLLASQ